MLGTEKACLGSWRSKLIFFYSTFVHNLYHEFWQAVHNSPSNVYISLCFALPLLQSLESSWHCLGEVVLLDAAWTCAPKIPTVSFSWNWQNLYFFPSVFYVQVLCIYDSYSKTASETTISYHLIVLLSTMKWLIICQIYICSLCVMLWYKVADGLMTCTFFFTPHVSHF